MKETERTRNHHHHHHLHQHHHRRRMMSSSLSSNEGRDIPDDVLFEIFLYLPADSLVQFRFVCKYWFNLITSYIRNPRFVQIHNQHHPPPNATITTDNLPTILYTPAKPCHSHNIYYSLNINASSSSKNKEATRIESVYPFKSRSSKLKILGSCNGLLCIQVTDYDSDHKDTLCLWNPSTNEFKEVSTAGIITPGYCVYGFGYDRLINDYKLVRLARCYYEVYTMGSNSWKRIDKEVPFFWQVSRSLYVNGALHWLSSEDNKIYSFNIEDEEFGVVPIPELSETVMCQGQLRVLRGCLCMFNGYMDQCSKGRFEVWMMMDYGVEESWTKLFRVINPKLMPWGHLNPLWICKNGEVLIENGTDQYLVIYDPNNKKVESIGYHDNPSKWTNTIVRSHWKPCVFEIGYLCWSRTAACRPSKQEEENEEEKKTRTRRILIKQGTDGGGGRD